MTRVRRADAGAAALVLTGTALFVAAVYAAVVWGGSAVLGRLPVALPILATAIVALGFEPIRRRLRPVAARLTGARATPYELLAGLRAEAAATDDLPARMARLLAEATGARMAQVSLAVDGSLVPAATWPPGATATGDGVRTVPVCHGGQTLGELSISGGQPLSPIEERLLQGLADQAGLVLRAVALRAELTERLGERARRASQLRASRERIVAAQDDERRRLERDIHDGAQQHLVALAVQLRLAGTLVSRSSPRAPAVVAGLSAAAEDAIAALTELSRGVYPRQLTEAGPGPALASATAGMSTVELELDDIGRLPPDAEHALYFCGLEAVQNAAKHAGAARILVRLRRLAGAVELVVSDDGSGFVPDPSSQTGRGLTNLADRAEAVGGELHVDSRPGTGTTVTVRVPAGGGG